MSIKQNSVNICMHMRRCATSLVIQLPMSLCLARNARGCGFVAVMYNIYGANVCMQMRRCATSVVVLLAMCLCLAHGQDLRELITRKRSGLRLCGEKLIQSLMVICDNKYNKRNNYRYGNGTYLMFLCSFWSVCKNITNRCHRKL